MRPRVVGRDGSHDVERRQPVDGLRRVDGRSKMTSVDGLCGGPPSCVASLSVTSSFCHAKFRYTIYIYNIIFNFITHLFDTRERIIY